MQWSENVIVIYSEYADDKPSPQALFVLTKMQTASETCMSHAPKLVWTPEHTAAQDPSPRCEAISNYFGENSFPMEFLILMTNYETEDNFTHFVEIIKKKIRKMFMIFVYEFFSVCAMFSYRDMWALRPGRRSWLMCLQWMRRRKKHPIDRWRRKKDLKNQKKD